MLSILKKQNLLNKKTTNNCLETYKYYLKDLNFFNKFKNKNKTLLKDILLLKINGLYLLNINLKENYFFPIISTINFHKNQKNNLIYFIQNQKNNLIIDMVINTKFINSFFFKFYIYFLFTKFSKRKFKITKFFFENLKKKKLKLYYKKRIKINLPFIKNHILKIYKKKYNLIIFCGLIFKIKSKYIYIKTIKKQNRYSSYLKKRFNIKNKFKNKFNKLKKKKYLFFFYHKLYKKKLKFNFSRIFLINALKKNNLNNLNNLNNFKLFKKYSFYF